MLRGAERNCKADAAKQPYISATEVLREIRDSVPTTELQEIRRKLDIASAVAYICAAALKTQTAENDIDVALALQRCCGDVLFEQTQQISRLLGEDNDADDGESESGGAQ